MYRITLWLDSDRPSNKMLLYIQMHTCIFIFYSSFNALASLTIPISLAKISMFGNSDLLCLGMVNWISILLLNGIYYWETMFPSCETEKLILIHYFKPILNLSRALKSPLIFLKYKLKQCMP